MTKSSLASLTPIWKYCKRYTYTNPREESVSIHDMVIGPGQRCFHCDEGYGGHTKDCPVPKQGEAALKKRQTELGKNVREALEAKDDLALGKLLLELKSE